MDTKKCINCPMIKEEFERFKRHYTACSDEELSGECWCDKLGGRIKYYDGNCSGVKEEPMCNKEYRSAKSNLTRHEKDEKYKQRLEKLYNEKKNANSGNNKFEKHHCPVVEKNHYKDNEDKKYYTKEKYAPLDNGNSKYYKKRASKAVRQIKDEEMILRGNQYKKMYDFRKDIS